MIQIKELRWRRLVTIALCCFLAVWSVHLISHPPFILRFMLVREGMKEEEVISLLGKPDEEIGYRYLELYDLAWDDPDADEYSNSGYEVKFESRTGTVCGKRKDWHTEWFLGWLDDWGDRAHRVTRDRIVGFPPK